MNQQYALVCFKSILSSLVRSENIHSSVSVPVDSIAYHLKRLETSVSLAAARLILIGVFCCVLCLQILNSRGLKQN